MTAKLPRWLTQNRLLHLISWNVFGQLGGKILYPVFQIVIARLLAPEDYGVFMICFLIYSFYSIIKDLGLTDSIIVSREKNSDIQLLVQLLTATIFYLLIYFSAEYIAAIFNKPELGRLVPVFMLAVFLAAYIDPIYTQYLKQQKFRLLAIRNILMPLTMGLTGVVLAYNGYGVDSLVYSFLAGHFAVAVLFFYKEGIMPVRWRFAGLGELLVLGKHLLFQRFLGFFSNQSDVAIIGKFVGAAELGIYRIALQIALLAPQALFPNVSQVLFTEFAKSDQNNELIVKNYRRYSLVAGGLLLLYTVSMYFAAPYLIPLLLGSKWQEVILIIPILAHSTVTGNITLINMEIAKIVGFSRHYSTYAVVRAAVTVVALIVAAQYGITVVAVVYLFLTLLFTLTNEVIFYISQDIVSLESSKVAIYVIAFVWAIFISWDALLKT